MIAWLGASYLLGVFVFGLAVYATRPHDPERRHDDHYAWMEALTVLAWPVFSLVVAAALLIPNKRVPPS